MEKQTDAQALNAENHKALGRLSELLTGRSSTLPRVFTSKDFLSTATRVFDSLPVLEIRSKTGQAARASRLGAFNLNAVDMSFERLLVTAKRGYPVVWVAPSQAIHRWANRLQGSFAITDADLELLFSNSVELWAGIKSTWNRENRDLADLVTSLLASRTSGNSGISVPYAFILLERVVSELLISIGLPQRQSNESDFNSRLGTAVRWGTADADSKDLRVSLLAASAVALFKSVTREQSPGRGYVMPFVPTPNRHAIVHDLRNAYLTDTNLVVATALTVSMLYEILEA